MMKIDVQEILETGRHFSFAIVRLNVFAYLCSMKSRNVLFLLLFLLPTIFGCSRHNSFLDRLDRLDSLVSDRPDSVLRVLETLADSVNVQPEAVRMRYALLKVKAEDKADIIHTDDSLILSVAQYYERHTDERLTPEALYYVGRVHADMGDAPQALDDFHQVLDAISFPLDDLFQNHLHCVTNAQIGYLLRDMRFYEKSIPYFFASLQDDKVVGDSVGMCYDYRDLAVSYFWTEKRDSALICYLEAERIAKKFGNSELMLEVMRNKVSFYRDCGEYQKALKLNTELISQAKERYHVNTIYLQGELFHRLGQLDSAVYYYKAYLESEYADVDLKESAAKGMGEIAVMKGRPDEAVLYFNDYVTYFEHTDSLRKEEAILKIIGLYNYQLRERQNKQLELRVERTKTERLVLWGVIVISMLVIWVAVREYKLVQRRSQLQEARLRHWAYVQNQKKKEDQDNLLESNQTNRGGEDTAESRIQKLRRSSSAQMVNAAIQQFKLIKNDEWEQIERDINEAYPFFNDRLLDIGQMNDTEHRVCLLLKMEVPSKDIAMLIGRTPAAVTLARKRLYMKCFGQKGSASEWDKYIKSL